MSGPALFFALIRWDFLRELRRKEIVLNMSLFAVLMLTIAQLGTSGDSVAMKSVGPVFFWMAIVFTGTVGLGQSFAAEREGGRLTGIQLAPIDLGIFYLAKVAATWVYMMLMSIALLGVYMLFSTSCAGISSPPSSVPLASSPSDIPGSALSCPR